MFTKYLIILLLVIFCRLDIYAQTCTTLGQTPSTAFPVCGTFLFKQNIVPLCVNNTVPASICGSYPDTNPFWYQFTCYASGTFGFLITPNDLGDDYDWELFDITGHNPNDVYTDPSLFVVANWCGSYGITGTSASAADPIECASVPSDNVSTYSEMPQLIQGHTYLLLISHYTTSQSGYQLSFSGGTASITDPNIPTLQNAGVQCDGETITVGLNKKVRCSTLAPDGSDFSISYPSASIISASGVNCNNGFDMDSVTLKLNNPLPPGNYTITAKIGTDGNTLLDDCNNSVVTGDNVSLMVYPQLPTPLDSISPVGCAPNQLQLVFRKPMQCSTIAPDGSDFVITGPSPVSIQSAGGNNCTGNLSSVILLNLNAPIVSGGTYQIQLVTGNDGNTIIDECNQETPAGSTISFTTKDTVSAAFNYQVSYGCKDDSIQFTDAGGNGINKWQWTFDAGFSGLQNPLVIYPVFGQKNAQLVVTNGVCSDTTSVVISLDNAIKAAFAAPDNICPSDKVVFQNNSTGNNLVSWYWDFGDGTSDSAQTPLQHSYPPSAGEVKYTVSLIIGNSGGCYDTATGIVTKVRSCYITVPSAFTPNGDGINDYLYPLNAYKAVNLEFKVFNRYGQLVFETKDWTKKWDGTINGKQQDIGTYAWMLQYTDGETGKRNFLKGTTVLIR